MNPAQYLKGTRFFLTFLGETPIKRLFPWSKYLFAYRSEGKTRFVPRMVEVGEARLLRQNPFRIS